jgi:formate hydrogenlyase subunit 3/multisubunit Na+/H+ antiporter MnhD subunit
MVGEALREAGTLVLVFAPLYVIFERSNASWITLVLTLFVGIAFLVFGIQVERRRQ